MPPAELRWTPQRTAHGPERKSLETQWRQTSGHRCTSAPRKMALFPFYPTQTEALEMTMADERTRAVLWGRELLMEIQRDEALPEQLRRRAKTVLRHFPSPSDIEVTAMATPDWWARPSKIDI